MILWLLGAALATEGWHLHRIQGVDTPTSLSVRTDAVVGPDGGVGIVELGARYTAERFSLGLSLPVAWFNSPTGRRGGVGNLQLSGGALLRTDGLVHRVGVDAWFPTNRDSYTWVNRAEQVWPSGGAVAVWEMRTTGETTWMARAWLGVLATRRLPPFRTAPYMGAAVGVDRTVIGPFGLAAELAMQWRDPSPIELTAAARVQATEGLQVRTGVVLPVGTWGGFSTRDAAAGVREATWWLGLSLSLDPS